MTVEPNPARIVTVTDYSAETLENLIAHLEVSTDFEHMVYRESELDALWSITGFALKSGTGPGVAEVHEIANEAHDLVAERRPREAAALLRTLL